MNRPVRLLTAVPVCDGHDSATSTIHAEFTRNGIEVVYLGFHRAVADIARAAVQEDAAAAVLARRRRLRTDDMRFELEPCRNPARRPAPGMGPGTELSGDALCTMLGSRGGRVGSSGR
jgi:hypothetical protein